MKIVKQQHEIIHFPKDSTFIIEEVARNCYQSHDKIKSGSDKIMVKSLIKSGHHTPLEFINTRIKLRTNKYISQQLTRHRIGIVFLQESQRYINYLNRNIEFIKPEFVSDECVDKYNKTKRTSDSATNEIEYCWLESCIESEGNYKHLIRNGLKPQQARGVLNQDVATKIELSVNLRELRHILKLRCNKKADPMMIELMTPILDELKIIEPILFEDI